ncbi:MAG: cell division protein FtsZ [Chloroflexota bacterium]
MRRYTNTVPKQAKIGVIGAGKSGYCSIKELLSQNYYHADFLYVDTDRPLIEQSKSDVNQLVDRIWLADQQNPSKITPNGTNGDFRSGEHATFRTMQRIKAAIRNFDMLFLFGGMGGGTATAALPVIAQAAAELDIMTVAIVTSPFGFEGTNRHKIAQIGINRLNSLTDTLIVLHGDELLAKVDNRVELSEAWSEANELRHNCISIVEELTQYPGIINIDFADIRAVIEGNGSALMTMGVGIGENKVEEAIADALNCKTLNRSATGAGQVLMHIVTPPDADLFEVHDIADGITQSIGEQAYIHFGVSEDNCLFDEVRVFLIATSFCEITQMAQQYSEPIKTVVSQSRERQTLADHFWSLAKDQMSGYGRWRDQQ